MGELIDLTNAKFGRLTVIGRAENDHQKTLWKCHCDCGKEKVVRTSDLRSGKVVSCGCLKKERCSRLALTRGHSIHHLSGTRLYWVWMDMKKRCYSPSHKSYDRYGGRGIAVCDEWKNDFVSFYDWAHSHGWSEGLQIDRIDNDGGYNPSNCRFVTSQQNNSNRCNTRKLRIGNREKSLSEWADIFGLPRGTVYNRSKKGMDLNNLFAPGRKED